MARGSWPPVAAARSIMFWASASDYISGQVVGRAVSRERRRVAWLGGKEIALDIIRADPTADENGSAETGADVLVVDFLGENKRQYVLASKWRPGDAVWCGTVDGEAVFVQVRPVPNGFDLAHRGVETRAYVYTEREAAAARLMPVKVVADSGKSLRCPMPGLVMAIAVVVGQEVKAGETLAVVEAMKMENVLRAERDGVVKAIKAKPGDSLAVDAVIVEFA